MFVFLALSQIVGSSAGLKDKTKIGTGHQNVTKKASRIASRKINIPMLLNILDRKLCSDI